MIAFRQTDLPEPVAPAMSRCGISARSVTAEASETPEPSAIGSCCCAAASVKTGASRTLRNVTIEVVEFGTSMPITDLPGTGASMRIAGAASASARSLASVVMRLTRMRVRETSTSLVRGWPAASSS